MEKRHHQRFEVKEGIFAVLGPDSNKLGPIQDISLGGLSFVYNHPRGNASPEPRRQSELTILFDGQNIHFSSISYKFNVKSIRDIEVANTGHFNLTKKKKCVVCFEHLSYHQKSWLENFIQYHTNGSL